MMASNRPNTAHGNSCRTGIGTATGVDSGAGRATASAIGTSSGSRGPLGGVDDGTRAGSRTPWAWAGHSGATPPALHRPPVPSQQLTPTLTARADEGEHGRAAGARRGRYS